MLASVSSTCQPIGLPPSTRVSSSSTLEVSWEGLFIGCDQGAIVEVSINIDGKTTLLEADRKLVYLETDPCLQHNITVALKLKDKNKEHVATKPGLYTQDVSYEVL